jgi:hypothetical protein
LTGFSDVTLALAEERLRALLKVRVGLHAQSAQASVAWAE